MNAKLKLAGLLATAAVAVPGAAAVSAIASDGAASATVTQQPVQESQPDRPGDDCPDKQGGNGSRSGSDSASGSGGSTTQL